MIKLSPHFWLSSLLSEDGHFHEPSPFPKIWYLSKKKYHNWKKTLIASLKRKIRKKRKNNNLIKDFVKYLIIGLILTLFIGALTGCNGVKHIIELQEPTDHTSGDDGCKIKYKLIFGDKTQKE